MPDRPPIEWLTVPAPDLPAAVAFYRAAFGFRVTRFSDGYYVFEAGNLRGGLDRALPVARGGIGFSITVRDIDAALARVVAHGGEEVAPPFALGPGAGWCARFTDPNGNLLELYAATRPPAS